VKSVDEDKALDSVVDDVARAMTAGEPHSSFRAQVMAQIETFEVRRSWFDVPRSWFGVRGLAAVAAVAAVVIVSFQLRQSTTPSAPAVAEAPALPIAEQPVVRSERPEGGSPRPSDVPSEVRASAVPSERPEGRALRSTTTSSAVAALAPPPLGVDSIALAELPPPPSIQLDELQTIAPIAVARLSPDDQGERR
jgi:hypothetical protein